jgi:hypothetical protein
LSHSNKKISLEKTGSLIFNHCDQFSSASHDRKENIMSKFVTMDIDGLVVRMQAASDGEITNRGGKQSYAIDPKEIIDHIKAYSSLVVKAVQETAGKPDSFTLELGLGAKAGTGIFIANVATEASLKVTISWTLTQ